MASSSSKFKAWNSGLLKKVKFFERKWRERTVFSIEENFIKELSNKIKKARKVHSVKYQNGYIDPLLTNLEQIIAALNQSDTKTGLPNPWKYAILTLLVNAALQPAQKKMAKHIRSVQAIVDNLHATFVDSRKRLGIESPLDHEVPPLVSFIGELPLISGKRISEMAPLPCMLELEQLRDKELLGDLAKNFTAGVVGLSLGYRDHPLLWGVLGHEVGGHYVLTADRDDMLRKELQAKIYDELKEKYKDDSKLGVLAPLWHYWTEEAASDVRCVLSLGPAAGIGAISFYTAMLYLSGWGKKEVLNGIYEKPVPPNLPDYHTVPVLVPDLICGAIETLELTNPEIGIDQLKKIAQVYTHGRDKMECQEGAWVPDPKKIGDIINLPTELPLDKMQESARLVGRLIATFELDALKGRENKKHALRDLTMWDDQDEGSAKVVADEFASSAPLSASTIEGTDASMIAGNKVKAFQVLAGGILAVMRNPRLYNRVTKALIKKFARK